MAMPSSRAELNQVIEEQVKTMFSDIHISNIAKLADHFGKFDQLANEFGAVKTELATIKSQLEGVLPQLEQRTVAGIKELDEKASAADAKLVASIAKLEQRDAEVSESSRRLSISST